MMRCCGGRWLKRAESYGFIFWHCEHCGFTFKEEVEE